MSLSDWVRGKRCLFCDAKIENKDHAVVKFVAEHKDETRPVCDECAKYLEIMGKVQRTNDSSNTV